MHFVITNFWPNPSPTRRRRIIPEREQRRPVTDQAQTPESAPPMPERQPLPRAA